MVAKRKRTSAVSRKPPPAIAKSKLKPNAPVYRDVSDWVVKVPVKKPAIITPRSPAFNPPAHKPTQCELEPVRHKLDLSDHSPIMQQLTLFESTASSSSSVGAANQPQVATAELCDATCAIDASVQLMAVGIPAACHTDASLSSRH
jgi:hypothetical protein